MTQVNVSEDDFVVNLDVIVPGPQGPKGDIGDAGPSGPAPVLIGTSSTTNSIVSTGTRTFALDTPTNFVVGMVVLAQSNASAANYMVGKVTAVSPTSITLGSTVVGGSGSPNSWTLTLSGYKGNTGTNGTQGIQGIQGLQGVQGDTGSKGDTGLQGATGPQGVKGDTGTAGTAGAKGDQGIQGVKGDTGAQGPQGFQGIQGNVGPAGVTGLTFRKAWSSTVDYVDRDAVAYLGSTWYAVTDPPVGEVPSLSSTYWFPLSERGQDGAQGPQGIQGATGTAGAQGIQGAKGDTGATGLKGDTGNTGSVGPQGVQGVAGTKGDKGDTGSQGIQGIQGATGVKGDIGLPGTTTYQGLSDKPFVDAADYGFLPGSTAAQNDTAIASALASGKAVHVKGYGPGTEYLISSVIVVDNKQLIGDGNVFIRQTTETADIIHLKNAKNILRGLNIRHANLSATSGSGIICTDVYLSEISQIEIYNCKISMRKESGFFFSNTVENLFINGYYQSAIAFSNAGSTGSVWTNIYVNNQPNGTPLVSSDTPVIFEYNNDCVFNQLNIEHTKVWGQGLLLNGMVNCTINGLHFEGVEPMSWNSQLMTVYGNSKVSITGMGVVFTEMARTGTDSGSRSVIKAGAGAKVVLNGFHGEQNTNQDNRTMRLARTEDNGSVVWLQGGIEKNIFTTNEGDVRTYLDTTYVPPASAGPAGPAGPQGIQGIQGEKGETGATGPAGPAGTGGTGGSGTASPVKAARIYKNGDMALGNYAGLTVIGFTTDYNTGGAFDVSSGNNIKVLETGYYRVGIGMSFQNTYDNAPKYLQILKNGTAVRETGHPEANSRFTLTDDIYLVANDVIGMGTYTEGNSIYAQGGSNNTWISVSKLNGDGPAGPAGLSGRTVIVSQPEAPDPTTTDLWVDTDESASIVTSVNGKTGTTVFSLPDHEVASGSWIAPRPPNSGTSTLGLGTQYFYSFLSYTNTTRYDLFRLEINTAAGAGASIRLGIYKNDPLTGLPDYNNLIVDLGTASTNLVGFISFTPASPVLLPSGMLWVSVIPQTANVVIRATQSATLPMVLPPGQVPQGAFAVQGLTKTGRASVTAMPTNPADGFTTTTNITMPVLFMRAV